MEKKWQSREWERISTRCSSRLKSKFILTSTLFFCLQPYTKKQWAKYPAQLDAEVFTRLPYREDNDDRCSSHSMLLNYYSNGAHFLLSQIL